MVARDPGDEFEATITGLRNDLRSVCRKLNGHSTELYPAKEAHMRLIRFGEPARYPSRGAFLDITSD